jgi:hypothetical protein
MTTTTTTQTVPLGDMVQQSDGTTTFVANGKTVDVTITDIYADTGKVFKCISDGAVLSNHITLGTTDSASNYKEVSTTTSA